MSTQTLSLSELREKGLKALAKALGPTGMIRFLQQYEGGTGNYTKERKELLKDLKVRDIIREIKIKEKKHKTAI